MIDHAAKPFIVEVTEANQQTLSWEDLVAYVHHVAAVFDTDRILFGSDWPVCLTTCSYGEVYDALLKALPINLSEEEHSAIFGDNAVRFYKLLQG